MSNPYHRPVTTTSVEADELCRLGLAGRLTEARFHEVAGNGFMGRPEAWGYRDAYTRQVSWAVFTTEFIESLVQLVVGKQVLEVCAGRGVLTTIMQARGVNWVATDIEPASPNVMKMTALEAVKHYAPDVIFVSWIPYESTLDSELIALGVPMILVGEGHGGCTGDSSFWDEGKPYTIQDLGRAFPWFKDVPQWPGIHDYTSIVVPAGEAFIWQGGAVVGPTVGDGSQPIRLME